MSTVDNNVNSSINIEMVGFEKHSGYIYFISSTQNNFYFLFLLKSLEQVSVTW